MLRGALVILSALAVLPASAAAPTIETFGPWQVFCTDTFDCNVSSEADPLLQPGTEPLAGALRLTRPSFGSWWELSFIPSDQMPAPLEPWTVTVDSDTETFVPGETVAPFGRAVDFHFVGSTAQAVMDRLASGTELSINYTDNNDIARTARFALDGLNQALIYVDEFQGRLGSERVVDVAPEGLTKLAIAPPFAPWFK